MDVFEVIGALIGLTYLVLEYKANAWLWPVGVLMSLFYVIIFFNGKFYADAAIYLYYIGANVYGWYAWRRADKKTQKAATDEIKIGYTPPKLWCKIVPVIVILWISIFLILKYLTDSVAPLGDAFTTAVSVVAMWMLSRKYVEQWLLWVAVNVVSMALYCWKGLYPTAILYVIYVVMSVLGYFRWRRLM